MLCSSSFLQQLQAQQQFTVRNSRTQHMAINKEDRSHHNDFQYYTDLDVSAYVGVPVNGITPGPRVGGQQLLRQ